MTLSLARAAAAALVLTPFLSTAASAQTGGGFQTPGMPRAFAPRPEVRPGADDGTGEGGQVTRFSNLFNPAFFFVVDAAADWQNVAGNSADDGVDLTLRALEVGAQTWVDPNAWAYFIGATEGEELAIEEAALHYVGFDGNSTLRAGRFFVDFGKQMQAHVHELRTFERPLVLRAFLGEEVKGDGLQWDHWTPAGDETVLRWSLGAFRSLFPEENDFFEEDLGLEVDERKDAEDLNFTARLTGFTELSESTTLQAGASARFIPDFSVEFDPAGGVFPGGMETGLSNLVYGLDLTAGWTDDTGQESMTFGGEFLVNSGDNGFDNPAAGVVDVFDSSTTGWYAFADFGLDAQNSVGAQYSMAEIAGVAPIDVAEAEVYWTHMLSEYHRLRCSVIGFDSDDSTSDGMRVVVQYTGALGAHAHGLNW